MNGIKGSLSLWVTIAAGAGALVGAGFGAAPIALGISTADLGAGGMLVIRLLKVLAVPLMAFAILDAFARAALAWEQVGRLGAICAINVCVAMTIGLGLMNTLRPGVSWRGHVSMEAHFEHAPKSEAAIPIVVIAVLGGIALRRLKKTDSKEMEIVERFIGGGYRLFLEAIALVIRFVPVAVFGVVAESVGRSGLGVFAHLWSFLSVILLGLGLHAFVYYPLIAWIFGRRNPRRFFGGSLEAILTGLSTNSSLATVPVTLRCLTEKLGVREASARLSACIGTNLNNDGITLYEAMAALFLTQACGFDLSFAQQLAIVGAALMAGMGVAGVPEAGLVVLPLVLGSAGLPEQVIAAAIPLIMPVDWIIARCRSAVNVMSDTVVAILLDRTARSAEDAS